MNRKSWLLALIPIALMAVLLAVIVWSRPEERLRGANVPEERLTFQRVTLDEEGITASVMNDGDRKSVV